MNKTLQILYHYLFAKRRFCYSRQKLERWQERHKNKIYRFAKKHSPFYRERLGKQISKKEMMESFSLFNTKSLDREEAFSLALNAENTRDFSRDLKGVTVGLSSGTSGNRGLFLASEKERLFWCGNILARVLPKAPWKRQKIAFFLRANSTLYESVQSKSLTFAYFDLLEDVKTLREKVALFNPDVLVAPPSMLLLLIGSCHPSRVVSVAETLFSPDKDRLEQGFGQKIFQVYQCTEGFLAFTCPEGTIHINEDLVLMEKEYIDEHSFIPIITDLFRTTQPIIRYRLDDVLVEKKGPCPCGCAFQGIERIEGRCDDLLHVAMSDGSIKPLFPDFVCRKIISTCSEIKDYAVRQTSLNRWEIYLDATRAKESIALALRDLFKKLKCLPPELVFVSKPFERLPGSKLRRITRTCTV